MTSLAKPLVVSIHDVRPGLFSKVVEMLKVLKEVGVPTTTLLVIPNFHRLEPLENHGAQVDQIRLWGASGHELMLHALYHREDRPASQGPLQYIISQHYTGGEGEFYRISYEEAMARLKVGKVLFQKLQFNGNGFTAPAWLYSPAARRAIADSGFGYYTTLWGVAPIAAPFIPARAVVWSHRAAWRRATSNFALPIIADRLMRLERPLRIALHPPDFDYAAIRTCALKIINRALRAGYQPQTYQQLVDAHAGVANNSPRQGSAAPNL